MSKSKEELLKPRYRVIAGYPCSVFIVNDVIELTDGKFTDVLDNFWTEVTFNKYPNIFRKLEWWEERSLEIFRSIKYAKVTTYRHYWLVGDVVEVTKLYLGSPKDFYGFDLQGKKHAFCDVVPADETEYQNLKTFNHGK